MHFTRLVTYAGKSSALDKVASTASGFLTSFSLVLKNPSSHLWQEGEEGGGWLSKLLDAFKFGYEFIQFLLDEGIGALTDPVKLAEFFFKDDIAGTTDAWVNRLLNDPGYTSDLFTVIFGFAVLAGVMLLFLKLNVYMLKIGYYSYEYTPWQIYNGETGLTSPYIYPVRFLIALTTIVSAPIVFAALWHIMHHTVIVEFVQAAYGESTFGNEAAEIILSLLDGRTLIWMWTTSPIYLSILMLFVVVYGLLNLAVLFSWVWMIIRTAKYGDGEHTRDVITDTGSWAVGLLVILGLTKLMAWLTPGAVNAVARITDLPIAFSVWLVFLTLFPFVVAFVGWRSGKALQGVTNNITLKHVIQPPKYTATAGVVASTSRKTAGSLKQTYSRAARTLSKGIATARRIAVS